VSTSHVVVSKGWFYDFGTISDVNLRTNHVLTYERGHLRPACSRFSSWNSRCWYLLRNIIRSYRHV